MTDERVTKWCRCDERMRAVLSQTMRFSAACGGWVLHDVPTRTMSNRAFFYSCIDRGKKFPHENHSGSPYVYEVCPWCGNDLPGTQREDEQCPPFDQADGQSGEGNE